MKRALGIVLGLIISASLMFQVWQLYRFVNAGPRFTADEGRALCVRIQRLEALSGQLPGDCEVNP